MKNYYVVGMMDTRSEFEFMGCTTNKKVADKWLSDEKIARAGWNSRQWPQIVKVKGLT